MNARAPFRPYLVGRPERAACPRCHGTGELGNILDQVRDCPHCEPPPDPCERCGDQPADSEASIPDIWAAHYLALCSDCADDGHRRQARADNYDLYD